MYKIHLMTLFTILNILNYSCMQNINNKESDKTATPISTASNSNIPINPTSSQIIPTPVTVTPPIPTPTVTFPPYATEIMPALEAQIKNPDGIALDNNGNIYVADSGNNKIKMITPNGYIMTLAGNGKEGYANGIGSNAEFNHPFGIILGNNDNIYVADSFNNRIRKIDKNGMVTTLVGNGEINVVDGKRKNVNFERPNGMAKDKNGNLYVIINSSVIEEITLDGIVNDVNMKYKKNNEIFWYCNVQQLVIDNNGIIYFSDSYGNAYNHAIWKITSDGYVELVAGKQKKGYKNGTVKDALFNEPYGIAVDSNGNIYVADTGNYRIRKITPDGYVSTVTFKNYGFPDGEMVNSPNAITIDKNNNLYVTFEYDKYIKKITPDGEVISIAGGEDKRATPVPSASASSSVKK